MFGGWAPRRRVLAAGNLPSSLTVGSLLAPSGLGNGWAWPQGNPGLDQNPYLWAHRRVRGTSGSVSPQSLITFVNKHLNKLNLEVTELETQVSHGVITCTHMICEHTHVLLCSHVCTPCSHVHSCVLTCVVYVIMCVASCIIPCFHVCAHVCSVSVGAWLVGPEWQLTPAPCSRLPAVGPSRAPSGFLERSELWLPGLPSGLAPGKAPGGPRGRCLESSALAWGAPAPPCLCRAVEDSREDSDPRGVGR